MAATFTRQCSEAEYLALPETKRKVELFDDVLVEQPSPTYRHQDLEVCLRDALMPAARAAGLWVYLNVSIRLGPGRIAVPDLLVRPRVTSREWLEDAAPVRLVCEVTSTNRTADTVRKMRYYAEAGIPWYLIVDPDQPTLTLYRLDGGNYVVAGRAEPGEILHLTEPLRVDLDPAGLVPED